MVGQVVLPIRVVHNLHVFGTGSGVKVFLWDPYHVCHSPVDDVNDSGFRAT